MKIPKLFFCNQLDDEKIYSLDDLYENLIDDERETLFVTNATPCYGQGVFYCSFFNEVGETRNGGCGNSCKDYKPRNGKNGRCRFSKNCYETGKQKFKLTINGIKKIKNNFNQ